MKRLRLAGLLCAAALASAQTKSAAKAAPKAAAPVPAKAQTPASAQTKAEKEAARAEKQAAKQERQAKAAIVIPNPAVVRLLQLPPDQREKEIAQMPEERQAQVRQNVDRWLKQPDALREQALSRYMVLQSLPPRRQQLVRQEVAKIREMPTQKDRQKYLESDEIKANYTVQETNLLRDMAGMPPLQ